MFLEVKGRNWIGHSECSIAVKITGCRNTATASNKLTVGKFAFFFATQTFVVRPTTVKRYGMSSAVEIITTAHQDIKKILATAHVLAFLNAFFQWKCEHIKIE